MNPSMLAKLEQLASRHEEVGALLATPEIINDNDRFRALSMEYSQLEPVAGGYLAYCQTLNDLDAAREMASDRDPDLRDLAQDELQAAEARRAEQERALQLLLLPSDPHDAGNLFLEIRAGTGGDEASLFAGDLFRMYERYAATRGWKVDVASFSEGTMGGYKEIIAEITGAGAFARLKFESGVHRVQRVPDTEASGRIHTSAATVAVLPEAQDVDMAIKDTDLRIETMRAQGAGGQHVNKTDSAVRITHIPTGIVVECQDDRSQHRNKAQAMAVLAARLYDARVRAQQSAEAAQRKSLVGSGDRSERIRTYNFPQGRVTDHRINLTLYKLDAVMQGELDEIVDALTLEHQADLLAALGEDA